jgi:hypothetical protein
VERGRDVARRRVEALDRSREADDRRLGRGRRSRPSRSPCDQDQERPGDGRGTALRHQVSAYNPKAVYAIDLRHPEVAERAGQDCLHIPMRQYTSEFVDGERFVIEQSHGMGPGGLRRRATTLRYMT